MPHAIRDLLTGCRRLPTETEAELQRKHADHIGGLLPVLGPLLGLGVLAFTLWDFLIDPQRVRDTFLLRLAVVLACIPLYVWRRSSWSPLCRATVLYWAYSGAVIVSLFLIDDGFLYGLAGATACVFAPAVIAANRHQYLGLVLPPLLLFAGLTAIDLPGREFLNAVGFYLFALGLSYVLLLVICLFRARSMELEQELIRAARFDPLTGVYNRGYLTELGRREIALAKRHGRSLAILMIDIDRFKTVNDTYGHHIGDEVIRAMAAVCRRSLRKEDHFGRIGGEEFVCVLPETGVQSALECAERIRAEIERCAVPATGGDIRFTVSIGVAILDASIADWDGMLMAADQAMYQAKNGGRNRVAVFAASQEHGQAATTA